MSTAALVFTNNLHTMLSALPCVRDGDVIAIHDARVATRRMRAVLPILIGPRPPEAWQDVRRSIRRIGRTLGKARDLDVALELLHEIEGRAPGTAAAAATMRARLLPEQQRRRRALIKRLERLDQSGLAHLAGGNGRSPLQVRAGRSAARLAQSIVGFAGRVEAAIDHASGVYFPRRAHALRVAIKKLRYVVELLDPGEAGREHLRVLRDAQETLGQIHDREVLAAWLKSLSTEEPIPYGATLRDVLEAEARSLFEKYLAVRQKLRDACQTLFMAAQPRTLSPARSRMLTLGALALPSAAMVLVASRARRM